MQSRQWQHGHLTHTRAILVAQGVHKDAKAMCERGADLHIACMQARACACACRHECVSAYMRCLRTFTRAMGPPTCASGDTWPMTKP